MLVATLILGAGSAVIIWIPINFLLSFCINKDTAPRYHPSVDDGSVCEGDTTIPGSRESKTAWTERELQNATQSPAHPLTKLPPSTPEWKPAGRSADSPQPSKSKGNPRCCHKRDRSGHPSTSNRRKPLQRVDILNMLKAISLLLRSGTWQVIAAASMVQLASAHPLALSGIDSFIFERDGTKLEQVSDPWAIALCFIMTLAGFAWFASVPWRKWTTKWCRHCLHASGFFSLTLSWAWTTILVTVEDANDNRRYLALGAWLMFTIAFIGECHHNVLHQRQYLLVVFPAFLTAGHLIQYIATRQQTDSAVAQSWSISSFYEKAPIVFTPWAIFLYCILPKSNLGDRPREEPDEGIEFQDTFASTGGGGNGNNTEE